VPGQQLTSGSVDEEGAERAADAALRRHRRIRTRPTPRGTHHPKQLQNIRLALRKLNVKATYNEFLGMVFLNNEAFDDRVLLLRYASLNLYGLCHLHLDDDAAEEILPWEFRMKALERLFFAGDRPKVAIGSDVGGVPRR
jgi:hypothetical protein